MRVTCCRYCEERYPACHDTCEKYLKERAENLVIHDKMMKDHMLNNQFTKMAVQRKERRRRSGKK